jgi:antitoxin CcdA
MTGGDLPMRVPLYDVNARRKTVSVTINADLVAKAAALGINISRTAEAAVIRAFEEAEKARIREEIREAMRMVDDYVAIHGMPFDDWTNETPPSEDSDHAA